jgi:hypothetical protein
VPRICRRQQISVFGGRPARAFGETISKSANPYFSKICYFANRLRPRSTIGNKATFSFQTIHLLANPYPLFAPFQLQFYSFRAPRK